MTPPSVTDSFTFPVSPVELPAGVPVGDALRALKIGLRSAPLPVLLTDTDLTSGCTITFANTAFCEHTGYHQDEVLGRSPRMFRGPGSDPKVGRQLVQTVAAGLVFVGEDVNYTKDGREYLVQWCVVPVLGPGGRAVRYLSYQKHTDRIPDGPVAESSSLLELIVHSADVGICVTDERRRFVRVNAAYCRLYGFAADELLGREFTLVLPPAARAEAARLHDRFLAGENVRSPDWTVVRKDGAARHVHMTAARLVVRGGRRFQVSTVTDVTDRAVTEAALREREARLRAIYKTAPVGILLATPDDRVVSANPTMAEMLRCASQDLAHVSAADLTHPDDRADERRQLSALLNGYANRVWVRKRVRRPDGSDFWADQASALVRNPDGTPGYFVHAVSDRTPMEQAARDTEDLLRRLTDAVPGAVYRYTVPAGQPGRYTFLSRGAARLFEKPTEVLLADPAEMSGMMQPAADDSTAIAMPGPAAGRSGWQTMYRVRLPSGRTRWVQEHCLAEPTADDGSVTWNGTFTDVTRLKEVEGQLRDHLELLQSVADNLPGSAVYRWEGGPDGGRFVYLSAGVERVLGVPRTTLTADPAAVERALDPDDRPGYRQALAAAARELAPVLFDGRVRGADGHLRWVRWRAQPRPAAGGRVVCDGLMIDVTDRVRAEQKQRATADLLRGVVDAFPGLISVKDGRGRYVLMNEYQAGLYGTTPEAAVGRTAADLIGPEYGAYTAGKDREAVQAFAPITYEETTPDARGRPHTWLTTKIPWLPPAGRSGQRPVGVINVSTDLGPLKAAEAERRQLEGRLADAERHASVAVLAAGVAHDFNNLMTAVLGHAELAADAADDPAAVRDHLGSVETAARRASDLCRQLLAFAGRRLEPAQPVDLAAAAREMAELLRAVVPRAIDLRVEAAIGLPATEADPGHVRQVLLNLVTNAAQAIGGKSGEIVVRVSPLTADAAWLAGALVRDAGPGTFVAVQVTDTGPGVPADLLPRLFDPYVSSKGDGRGLGLAAVRGVSKAVGGAVRVDTAAGQGTTFTVLFPATDRPARPLSGVIPMPPPRQRQAGGTVLIADPHPGVRAVAAAALIEAGYEVVTLPDAARAAAALRADPTAYAAAVLGGEPFDADTELTAAVGDNPGVPLVVTRDVASGTGHGWFTTSAGCVFLAKPFRSCELMAAVNRAVDEGARV